jgi:site-specific recombinase XerD
VSESTSPKPKKLLDQLRNVIRIKHYSYATEKSYIHWTKRNILFHNKRHPAEMGVLEIEAFLSHLAQEGRVSASTQNQAFNDILFLYRNVLKIELATPIHALRAKRAQRLPIMLSKSEVSQVLSEMLGLSNKTFLISYYPCR